MVTNGCNSQKEEKPKSPEELFLGQNPPGLSPQVFIPGIISTDDPELEPAFAPNMKEFYFLRQSKGERSQNFVIHYESCEWSKPVERSTSEGEVFIATDNNTIHLGNTYRERTDDGWTDEGSLGAPFDELPIMRLTASSSGTYFFDERDSIGTIR